MAVLVGGLDAPTLLRELEARAFPVNELCAHPISALEGRGGETEGVARPACSVGCLACCADALRPSDFATSVAMLTPEMLRRFLTLAEHLAARKRYVISRGRLNFFSGSNELDHPKCTELRDTMSKFLLRHHGVPLGFLSSDIAFHISRSRHFQSNLSSVLDNPILWDNICFSIDEQIPMRNGNDYERYLESLRLVWKTLEPALKGELAHAKPARVMEPRVILNFLVPSDGAHFQPGYSQIYAGGPERATSYQDLVARYVRPFVGELLVTSSARPEGHIFSTAVGSLSGVRNSRVYISNSNYLVTERGRKFISASLNQTKQPSVIRTKLIPVGDNIVRVKACFATTEASEDEIGRGLTTQPSWFASLENISIDLSGL